MQVINVFWIFVSWIKFDFKSQIPDFYCEL